MLNKGKRKRKERKGREQKRDSQFVKSYWRKGGGGGGERPFTLFIPGTLGAAGSGSS